MSIADRWASCTYRQRLAIRRPRPRRRVNKPSEAGEREMEAEPFPDEREIDH